MTGLHLRRSKAVLLRSMVLLFRILSGDEPWGCCRRFVQVFVADRYIVLTSRSFLATSLASFSAIWESWCSCVISLRRSQIFRLRLSADESFCRLLVCVSSTVCDEGEDCRGLVDVCPLSSCNKDRFLSQEPGVIYFIVYGGWQLQFTKRKQ